MARNLLSDVNVVAISLVDKGANRKRFFLRKQEADETLFDLPAPHKLLKSDDDWSTAYCVVAEPGWEESPGQGAADQATPDVWASEDEIRRAAHGFMKNGALVNKMHESLDKYGDLVENAVALSNITVGDETIKKGSWYVAIEPSDEGKQAIASGEFTGVSVQGSGVRKLEKSAADDVSAEPDEKTMRRSFLKWLGLDKPGASEEDSGSVTQGDTAVSETTNTQPENDRLAKVEEAVTKTSEQVAALATRMADIAEKLADSKKDEKDPAEEVYHRLDDVTKSIEGIRGDVERLAKGSSVQRDERPTEDVKKSDSPLAGILD